MIDKMTKFSFILLTGESEAFLGKLQELGVVDITRSVKPVDEKSAQMFDRLSEVRRAIAALEDLDYSKDPDRERIEALAASTVPQGCRRKLTLKTLDDISSLETRIAAARKSLETLAPWGEFDRNAVDDLAGKGLQIHFHCVQSKKFNPEWEKDYALQVISSDKNNTWFVTVTKSGEPYDFPVPEIPAPAMSVAEAEKNISALKEELIASKAMLLSLRNNGLGHMRERLGAKTAEFDRYLAETVATEAAEGYLCIFEGFAPQQERARLVEAFDGMGILYLCEDARVEDNPPIKLRNNRFVRMFEVLTDMYGRPVYNGFDPTPYISVFFMLFFAMCMGDAGYGLILILAGLALGKVKSFKSLAPLVTVLGAATVVVGFFFHTFFSIDISQWEWVKASGLDKVMVPGKIIGYDGTMVVAIIVGIIHLCLAMIVRTVNATKNLGFFHSLSIWGWTVFIVGTIVALAAGMAFNLDSSVTKWIIIGLGAVAAIGIFPLRNIGKNPLINIGGGLWETYNTATGLLGDVLSYLRLYALGLAGSMLGFAFNTLAVMARGDGGFGWIAFIAIALIGHVLNIAMAVLGAFVHPLRLNFLEFFKNSDYDGSGRNYNPLKK
ncbi:MAG: V-type ATPase 116kDa subunit family protein [Bacteroidales bacterium]|nr:V-type ATPase 116kDa subunit family protein [Bacteroidales bacterium]